MTGLVRLSAVVIGAAVLGCHHHGTPVIDNDGSIRSDFIRGIVSVTGTAFEQHIVLRTDTGIRPLAFSSADDSLALSGLGGTDVIVYGAELADRFQLSSFVVQSVEGASVVDGVLMRDRTHFALRTRTGDVALGNPPAAFAKLVGARLWVGGPLAAGPNVYGVIRPASE